LGVMVSCEKILQAAIDNKVDAIGLSGLITPSLDEMVHVAREMERLGFKLPILIGGATTSRAHTAVKIAPGYSQTVVHVLDASRAVGIVGQLYSKEHREEFARKNKADQEKLRVEYSQRSTGKPLLPLQEARKRRTPIQWKKEDIAVPEFTGIKVIDPFPLEEIVPFIDWSPFFHTWELRGRYPSIFDDATVGPKAKELFDDAQKLLQRIVKEKRFTAKAIYGFFPANSVGDDIELYTDESRTKVATVFHTLRQQMDKPADQHNHALSDFIAPKETGLADYLGAFAVTSGHGVDELCAEFDKDMDDYNSIMTKALADRLAEALAECLHKRVRREWGYGASEALTHEELIREKYRGIRPAAGYPACPDHTEKPILWKLLDVEAKTGIKLTESCAMWPASSVSGLYFAHPETKYFGVGKIDRDQVLDYHLRKDMTLQEVEKWLGPNLQYDPDTTTKAASPAATQKVAICDCGVPHPVAK
ncbi:MAG: hypothetical protein JWM04_545, partial [Verrucomicrobiales bacterium]|nr:hypothetical protein [Verrucomicrobiales bacterium]